MDYTLFLDDVRNVPWWLGSEDDVIVCRTVASLIKTIEELGTPSIISFDHDLGDEPNAHEGLKTLIEMHLDREIDLSPIRQVWIHSSNPAGAENIRGLWDSFSETVLQTHVKAKKREAR